MKDGWNKENTYFMYLNICTHFLSPAGISIAIWSKISHQSNTSPQRTFSVVFEICFKPWGKVVLGNKEKKVATKTTSFKCKMQGNGRGACV